MRKGKRGQHLHWMEFQKKETKAGGEGQPAFWKSNLGRRILGQIAAGKKESGEFQM